MFVPGSSSNPASDAYNLRLSLNSDRQYPGCALAQDTVCVQVGKASVYFRDERFRDAEQRILAFDLGSDIDNANLALLLNRKKGERLRVTASGKLVKASGFFFYGCGKASVERRVQKVVTRVLGQLNTFIKGRVEDFSLTHKIVLSKILTESPL